MTQENFWKVQVNFLPNSLRWFFSGVNLDHIFPLRSPTWYSRDPKGTKVPYKGMCFPSAFPDLPEQ